MTWTRVRLESLISRLVTRLDKQLIRLGLDLDLNTKDLWLDLDLSPSNRKRLDYLAQVRDLKVPYYRYHCSDLTSAPVNATSWQPIPQSTPHSFCPSNHLFHHNPAQYGQLTYNPYYCFESRLSERQNIPCSHASFTPFICGVHVSHCASQCSTIQR